MLHLEHIQWKIKQKRKRLAVDLTFKTGKHNFLFLPNSSVTLGIEQLRNDTGMKWVNCLHYIHAISYKLAEKYNFQFDFKFGYRWDLEIASMVTEAL